MGWGGWGRGWPGPDPINKGYSNLLRERVHSAGVPEKIGALKIFGIRVRTPAACMTSECLIQCSMLLVPHNIHRYTKKALQSPEIDKLEHQLALKHTLTRARKQSLTVESFFILLLNEKASNSLGIIQNSQWVTTSHQRPAALHQSMTSIKENFTPLKKCKQMQTIWKYFFGEKRFL